MVNRNTKRDVEGMKTEREKRVKRERGEKDDREKERESTE